MKRYQRIGLLLCSVLMVSTGLNGSAPLRIKVSPAVSRAPAQVTVRATIEADSENRTLQIVAESADYYRRSEVQIDGKNAPTLSVFEFQNLPPGFYEIRGVLVGANGPRATVSGLAKVERSVGSR